MIIEIATVVTAIATASSAVYLALAYRDGVRRAAPAVRIHYANRYGDCALINLTIFPTDHHVVIRRISTSATGIAQAPFTQSSWGDVEISPAHEHFPSIDVDLDLLPAHVSSNSVNLPLSIKLRKAQSSVRISFHNDRSRFAKKQSVTAMIANPTE